MTSVEPADTGRELLDALAAIEKADGEPTPEMLDRIVAAWDAHPGSARRTDFPARRPR